MWDLFLKKTIRIDEVKDIQVAISLQADQQDLAEMKVKSRTDKEWQRQYNRFEKQLPGTTNNFYQCTIQNPWVVNFSPEKKKQQVFGYGFSSFRNYQQSLRLQGLFLPEAF